ncbi:MAG: hypothetical protein ACM31C_16200, partial [Acidobacteriota bacterium]
MVVSRGRRNVVEEVGCVPTNRGWPAVQYSRMDGKLGTFGGVFTPSLLTILGVIMYLRMPWLIGTAGLYQMLAIMVAAHVVSVACGLAVSSIATDKKVGVGGSYYILSRSFGLPIGGAIGLALFVGLSFSISLHIVGFCESMLSALDIPASANAIRVCGTITLLALTALIFISTSLAIKTQYAILVMIAASLVVVFLGARGGHAGHAGHTEPVLATSKNAPGFGTLFGIFFPATTGFMAGVNMSGDLRDPKGSIPKGTMAAIGVAAVVYVVLAVFLAMRVDRAALQNDPEVLQHIALSGPVVVAGIWGASLSSALGAILGAPRILQALSVDRITPRVFAAGRGASNEPRNALILAFAIGEIGILIAQLDLIARVVSTVFLALYGAISLTCAVESWANPDFRPKFRIPKLVGLIGAGSALVLMIQLDLLATAGAAALLLGLYGYLQRRQLRLEGGGTWEGIWSTIVRAGLHRLSRARSDQGSWRPNVMLFDDADADAHAPIRAFAVTLASSNGMVSDFALVPRGTTRAGDVGPAAQLGVFDVSVPTTDPLDTAATMCRYHGFTGVPPNTLLVPWRQHAVADKFLHLLEAAEDRDLNVLLFEEARSPRRADRPRIDLWWAPEAGNLALGIALVRFITRAPEWERANLTVLIVGDGGDGDALLRAKAVRFLDGARVDARVRVVVRPSGEALHDLVCNESRPADLLLVGLPERPDKTELARLGRVAALPGGVVFLRASGAFPDVLGVRASRAAAAPHEASSPQPRAAEERELDAPVLPAHPELAAAVTAVLAHQTAQLATFQDRVASAARPYLELCDTARELVVRRAEALSEAAREPNPARRRRLANRATGAFATEANSALERLADEEVAAQATVLVEQLAAVAAPAAALPESVPALLRIERPRSDFRPAPGDSRALRRWKRRRRWTHPLSRKIAQTIPIGKLVGRMYERIVSDEVTRVIDRFRTATHDLSAELGRVLATTEWSAHAHLASATLHDADAVIARLHDDRAAAVRRLDGIRENTRQRFAEHQVALRSSVYSAVRRLSQDLDRVDAPVIANAPVPRHTQEAAAIAAQPASIELWRDRELLVLHNIRIAVGIARFFDRLTVTSTRHVEELASGLRGSGLRACLELRAVLAARDGAGPVAELHEELPYEPNPVVARFAQAVAAATGELPENEVLLTNEALAALVRGDQTSDTVSVPVRSAVQSIVETELITRLGAEA